MPTCDLCNQPLGDDARRFSAEQVKYALRAGLRTGGSVEAVDRTVCAFCASAIEKCLFESQPEKAPKEAAAAASHSALRPARVESPVRVDTMDTPSPTFGRSMKSDQNLFRRNRSIESCMEKLSTPDLPKLVSPDEVNFVETGRLSDTDLDRLPFGVITLDPEGKVLFYNEWQSRLTKLPRYLVLNRNYFSEIAPCTRVAAFEGRFRDYVKELQSAPGSSKVEAFDYVFTFVEFEYVKIVFAPAIPRGAVNIMIFKQDYEKFTSSAELYRTVELDALKTMSDAELDVMSYGVVTLDKDDHVTAYNRWQSQFSGIPRHRVLNQHWFKAVAPYTRIKEFEGRYRAFKNGSAASEMFDFIFPFSRGVQFANCLFLPAREETSVNLVVFKRKLII